MLSCKRQYPVQTSTCCSEAGGDGSQEHGLLAEEDGLQGVQDLAKFLASSNKAEGQEDTQVLLDSSGRDNPKYQNQVYPVGVRLCTSPQAQHGLCRCSGSYRIWWERCPVPSTSPCWACCALCTWIRKAGSVYPPWALWGRPWLAWASVAGVKGELRSSRPHIPRLPSRRTAPPH
ncbi:armadillo-like helical domain containing protein 1 isoform X1 [Corapipo altera]|uniref:armadillo-like helical domain containing protein 1 isoform X1 n=1 Tax=Corapipo altera TaxID=415028 RepID=UPI000FD6879D|nr:armadillo-like helical domain containing protein 1 isoform X1 [Corapipo altera]